MNILKKSSSPCFGPSHLLGHLAPVSSVGCFFVLFLMPSFMPLINMLFRLLLYLRHSMYYVLATEDEDLAHITTQPPASSS